MRFESPLISSYRKITLPSPPPTPLLSPPRSPLPPPFPRQRISNQHRLILSRSLPNSPQRKLGQSRTKKPPIGSQKSLATRLLQALWPSRSTENLHQAASSRSANESPSKTSLPGSSSLTLLSSPSPALCRLWEEERLHREVMAKFQLAIQLQQQCQPINLQHFHCCGAQNGGGVAVLARGIRPSAFGPSSEGACRPALRRCPPAFGVNSSQRAQQQEDQAFPWAQKQPNFWQPPPPPPRRSIPSSQSFPPPTGMAASSSSAAHHHQHAYNELEDFGEDFVPRSSGASSRQNRVIVRLVFIVDILRGVHIFSSHLHFAECPFNPWPALLPREFPKKGYGQSLSTFEVVPFGVPSTEFRSAEYWPFMLLLTCTLRIFPCHPPLGQLPWRNNRCFVRRRLWANFSIVSKSRGALSDSRDGCSHSSD